MRRLTTLSLLALAAACGASMPRDPGYVGSRACAECHRDESRAWSSSAHALAMQRMMDAARVAAPFDGVRRDFASMSVTPQDVMSRREQAIHEGSTTITKPMVFVLGHLEVEQFVTSEAGGRLQALPIGYDPEEREWFDIFPEAPKPTEWAYWRNPGANANSQCLECHTTGYAKGYRPASDSYDTSWHEIGVGCEACHGPGRKHVAARRTGASDSYGVAPVDVGPGCVYCHALRRVIDDGYRPGDEPADRMDPVLLDSDQFHADGQLSGEAYEWTSFRLSEMYRRGVRCADCHEPHGGRPRADGNALCLRCHDAKLDDAAHTHHERSSPGARCVGCHMPEHTFMERDARRDHYIAPPDPEGAAAIGAPDACTSCHTDRSQTWAGEWVARWWGPSDATLARRRVSLALHQGREGDRAGVTGLLDVLGDAGLDPLRRASAARLLEQWTSDDVVRASLVRAATDPDPFVRAGALYALGQLPQTDEATTGASIAATRDAARLVRVEAAFALRTTDTTALAPSERDGVDRAFGEWLGAQRALGELPETNFNRGIFLTARGDLSGAEAAYRRAISIWPWDRPPYQNLAMVLVSDHRPDEAETVLHDALRIDPDWPPARFSLALLLAGQARWQDAVEQLEATVRVDPTYPRAMFNLGLAYAHVDRLDKANTALELAVDDPSAHADALRELVRLAMLRNDPEARDRWLPRALLADPNVGNDPRVRAALGMTD